eukprot:gnl/TRDRNA2_/TRDRNA2_129597_c0_seq1.p1 gnl/TRDRNA2_/TRDRNA2_129597_c0~~gnl/TRDRNA2_/TRDRNA2_129597_c0_seq1.p1  ORF type:complete len:290 (-),score=62.95 gnl/TRDRNA2_/TRDRNA2_129597_c0_seq1:178-972(-)
MEIAPKGSEDDEESEGDAEEVPTASSRSCLLQKEARSYGGSRLAGPWPASLAPSVPVLPAKSASPQTIAVPKPRARKLPDPSFVEHVNVETHLEVARRLDVAEQRSEELAAEVTSLRSALLGSEESLRLCRAQLDRTAGDKQARERECDRVTSDLKVCREEGAQDKFEVARLTRLLAEARNECTQLEEKLRQSGEDILKARNACDWLEKENKQRQRQLQSVRSLACAECRLRSRDLDKVTTFFVEEPWKQGEGGGRPPPRRMVA